MDRHSKCRSPGRKRLRCGFTTGAAAAAATRAALEHLVGGRAPETVRLELPAGPILNIPVHACRCVGANTTMGSVIKDAGDDPDITHGAEIGARVTWKAFSGDTVVAIRGGRGVGRVTRPGLEVPPGHPAINPVPQQMIRQAVYQFLADRGRAGQVVTEIFVPRGEALARRTLNARLGIIGGLSILGTTGIVRPLSHEAYTATIRAALSVARASGLRKVVLTTGRRSERLARQRWPGLPVEAFVQIGDFFARAMEMAADLGFEQVKLAMFFGKAVKMAQGLANTHARSTRLNLEKPAQWTPEITGDPVLARCVAHALTARAAFNLINDRCPEVIGVVRLHTGDPSLYGAVREQMEALRARRIPCRAIPGVTAAFAAAAAMGIAYTVPEKTQTLIFARMAGRTPVPDAENLETLARHGASMVIYLSMSLIGEVTRVLSAAYGADAACAVACRVSRPEEKIVFTRVGCLSETARAEGIQRLAIIIVGPALENFQSSDALRSKLYHKDFKHAYRGGQ